MVSGQREEGIRGGSGVNVEESAFAGGAGDEWVSGGGGDLSGGVDELGELGALLAIVCERFGGDGDGDVVADAGRGEAGFDEVVLGSGDHTGIIGQLAAHP